MYSGTFIAGRDTEGYRVGQVADGGKGGKQTIFSSSSSKTGGNNFDLL